MSHYQMGRRKAAEAEETDQLLLRPRLSLINKLNEAADRARRVINRNQVAIEILERYLPLWEEAERQTEAAVREQFARALGGAAKGGRSNVPESIPEKDLGRKKPGKKERIS